MPQLPWLARVARARVVVVRHARRALLIALGSVPAFGASACLDTRVGTRADAQDTRDTDTLSADTDSLSADATDTVPSDTTGPCTPPLAALASSYRAQLSELDRGSPRFVTPTHLVGTHRTPEAGARAHIVAIEVGSGTRVPLLASNGDTSMADARDGALIGFSQDPSTGAIDLFYTELTLHEGQLSAAPPTSLVTFDQGTGYLTPGRWGFDDSVHAVEHGLAAWAEHGTSVAAVHRVRVYRAGSLGGLQTLAESTRWLGAPYVGAGRVLWTEDAEPRALWMHDTAADRTVRLDADPTIESYVLTRDAAWWLADGKLTRAPFDGSSSGVVDPGPCSALVAGERGVVAVCGPEAAPSWLLHRGTPVYFDGSRRVSLAMHAADPTTRDLAALTLHGNTVAWLEYPRGAGCEAGFEAQGELVLNTVDAAEAGSRPISLATVGAGCWCCDAIWPPPHLDLSDRALTWNYPAGADPRPITEVGLGLFAGACTP